MPRLKLPKADYSFELAALEKACNDMRDEVLRQISIGIDKAIMAEIDDKKQDNKP